MSTQIIIVDTNVSVRPIFKAVSLPPTPEPVVIQAAPAPTPVPTPIPLVVQPTVITTTTTPAAIQTNVPIIAQVAQLETGPRWRRCSDGIIVDGTPPDKFIEVLYSPTDTCWEPGTVISFEPSLSEALVYVYQRGTGQYPEAKQFTMYNASSVITFEVNLTTNNDIAVRPNAFILPPLSSKDVLVKLPPQFIETLGDGISTIDMVVDVKQLI